MKSKIKKIISTAILLSLFISIFLPYNLTRDFKKNEVVAVIPIHIFADQFTPIFENMWEGLKDQMKGFGKQLAQVIVMQLTQDIVNWIDSGFQGNPAFIQDPGGFLERTGDIAIGEFIFNNPDLNFLCDPIKVEIQLALGLQYQPFRQKINCTLSEVVDNVEDAYDNFASGNFIDGGGWDTWLNMTVNPANTKEGAFLIAQGAMEARIKTSQGTLEKETSWSGGALSLKKCTKTYYQLNDLGEEEVIKTEDFIGSPFYDTSGIDEGDRETGVYTKTNCSITTPGKTITDKLSFMDTSAMRMLELKTATADAFDAIMSALANQLVKYALNTMKEGILGRGEDDDEDYKAAYDKAMDELEQSRIKAGEDIKRISGGGTTGDSLSEAKNSAKSEIENVIEIERNILSTRRTAKQALNTAKQAFASSSQCINLNDPQKDSRNPLILNIIEMISGNTYTVPPEPLKISGLVVNIKTLNEEIDKAQENIASLESKKVKVDDATTQSAINTAISGINSSPYHKAEDVKTTVYEQKTKDWIKAQLEGYLSAGRPCSVSFESLSL